MTHKHIIPARTVCQLLQTCSSVRSALIAAAELALQQIKPGARRVLTLQHRKVMQPEKLAAFAEWLSKYAGLVGSMQLDGPQQVFADYPGRPSNPTDAPGLAISSSRMELAQSVRMGQGVSAPRPMQLRLRSFSSNCGLSPALLETLPTDSLTALNLHPAYNYGSDTHGEQAAAALRRFSQLQTLSMRLRGGWRPVAFVSALASLTALTSLSLATIASSRSYQELRLPIDLVPQLPGSLQHLEVVLSLKALTGAEWSLSPHSDSSLWILPPCQS